MTLRQRMLIALLGAAIVAAPAAARAADEEDARPHAGLSIGGQATRFVNNHALGNDWFGGANLRFHFGPVIALEASTDYRRFNGNDQYPTQGSLLFYLWPQRLAPYVLGGGTWYFENGSAASHTLFGPHAGAGAEFFLIRHVSLDVNWRYHWVENLNSGSNYFNRSYSSNGSQWRMGANFYF